MRFTSLRRFLLISIGSAAGLACAPTINTPPMPSTSYWPDPTFSPQRQCHGDLTAEDVEHYLPRARLAMSLPGTQTVAVAQEQGQHCINVVADDAGTARLVELVLRGVAVPRRAVWLQPATTWHY